MSSKQWYELWHRLEHRLSQGIITLRPLPFGQDPKPLPARQTALWRRAVLKKERALGAWMLKVRDVVFVR